MKRIYLFLLSLLIVGKMVSCQTSQEGKNTETPRIFYVNSYHPGYGSSDDVMAGIESVLSDKNVQWKTTFMDTKNHPGEAAIQTKVDEILQQIEEYQPHLIIASDDNAIKYLIEPYFKNQEIPVVFCGVNWSADQYGLPASNVTGMLEVLPIQEMLIEMKNYYPEANQLMVLSENTNSEKKNKTLLDTLYQRMGFSTEYALVNNFEEWKSAFLRGNEKYDLIFIPTNGAIKNWNETAAIEFVKQNIKVPVLASDDFMMKYAVFGLTKIAAEQGEWAAKTALDILEKAKNPDQIPLAKNQQTKAWINQELAEVIGFKPDPELSADLNIVN